MQSTRFATRHLLICALLPLLVVAVFWPATRNGFVNYDDPAYVLRNPWVQAGPTLQSLRWALTATSGANWHPLTWISHMVDCRLFGLQPRGHHLTSVVLHPINTLLGYLVLRKLTGSTWRSLCVAVLFGLGLMAKPQIITFPFVLLLWDYWPLRRMSVAPDIAIPAEFKDGTARAQASLANLDRPHWPTSHPGSSA